MRQLQALGQSCVRLSLLARLVAQVVVLAQSCFDTAAAAWFATLHLLLVHGRELLFLALVELVWLA